MRSKTVLLVVLLAGCQGSADRRNLERFESSAQALLRPMVTGEWRDDQLRLLDGRLRVSFQIRHDEGDALSTLLHLHALATTDDRTSMFDVCLFGVDSEETARVFVGHALPPIVSQLEGKEAMGARRFEATSTFGVPGHAGFVGPLFSRGTADPATLLRAGIYSDPPPIPGDDRVHLLKAIFYANEGRWLRTLELDGPTVLEKDRLVPVTTFGEGALVQFAIIEPPTQ